MSDKDDVRRRVVVCSSNTFNSTSSRSIIRSCRNLGYSCWCLSREFVGSGRLADGDDLDVVEGALAHGDEAMGTEALITFDMDMNCSSMGSQDPQIKSLEDSVKFFIQGWSRRSNVEISRWRRLCEPTVSNVEWSLSFSFRQSESLLGDDSFVWLIDVVCR